MPTATERESLALCLRRHAAVKPFRELTAAQEKVADLLARGWSYKRIGVALKMSPRTVQHHVNDIATWLPADDLPARERVQIWAGCVAWDAMRREER